MIEYVLVILGWAMIFCICALGYNELKLVKIQKFKNFIWDKSNGIRWSDVNAEATIKNFDESKLLDYDFKSMIVYK